MIGLNGRKIILFRMTFNIPEFPNSKIEPFYCTSPMTPYYNCIAWAFGDDTKWYWPDSQNIYYWPPEIQRTEKLESFIELFKLTGYQVCESSELEINFEKVAIYTNAQGVPTHAARQLPNGLWTSKLGRAHDISHTLFSMENGPYGNAVVFMKRSSI